VSCAQLLTLLRAKKPKSAGEPPAAPCGLCAVCCTRTGKMVQGSHRVCCMCFVKLSEEWEEKPSLSSHPVEAHESRDGRGRTSAVMGCDELLGHVANVASPVDQLHIVE
jgi:hypothetical protein